MVRLKLDARPTPRLGLDLHAVAAATSPPAPGTTSIAAGGTRRFLDLEWAVTERGDLRVVLELDRLSLAWEDPGYRLVAGRQAITWGVNFFWPVLDLFAPFAPERIDREYKPGVDALRLTVPVGPLSEVELVAAGQGASLADDGSAAALIRVHLGAADVGVMAGWFHRDVVAGGFLTADARGTGLRGEVAFTDSGDPGDRAMGRGDFWRLTLGLDRQLSAALTLTAELAWNTFGGRDPREYPRIAASDRVERGEIASVGRAHAGASLAWQAHPLVTLTAAALLNLGDGSALFLPHLDWSLADNLALAVGLVVGAGPGREADGSPGSEYGAAPDVVYASIKAYF